MKKILTNKWTHLILATNALLFSTGCINTGDVVDAATAPVIGAVSEVVAALLNTLLTNIGLLPAA